MGSGGAKVRMMMMCISVVISEKVAMYESGEKREEEMTMQWL